MFRNAYPSNLRGTLLDGNKDHFFKQARSDLAKQERHVEFLDKCIGELQRQTEEQRLELQDAQYGYVKYARNGRNEESARTWSRRILCKD